MKKSTANKGARRHTVSISKRLLLPLALVLFTGLLMAGVTIMTQSDSTNTNTQSPSPTIYEEDTSPSATPQTLAPLPQTKEACEQEGGEWMTSPLGGEPFCNRRFEDGGKACTRSSQCQSNVCLVDDESSTTGKCSELEVVFGCYTYLEEQPDGEVSPVSICVD